MPCVPKEERALVTSLERLVYGPHHYAQRDVYHTAIRAHRDGFAPNEVTACGVSLTLELLARTTSAPSEVTCSVCRKKKGF